MTRRRSGTNWSRLRGLIEFNLRQRPEFQKDFRLEEKIQSLGQGLFHRNYLFEAAGEVLVLRLSKVERGWQSRKEAVIGLRKEAKTLQALEAFHLPFEIPKLVCLVKEDSGDPVGLIESAVNGESLSLFCRGVEPEFPLKIIAEAAVAVHKLPKSDFTHLTTRADSRAHVEEQLRELSPSLFERFKEAAKARGWILDHLPQGQPSTILHGDLLPQNLLFDDSKDGKIAVIDWECAQIGDPAYDLAIVTRGARKPLGATDGLRWLVEYYNEIGAQKITLNAVIVHELLFHLKWTAEAIENRATNCFGGHGPEHYAGLLRSILGRAQQLSQE
jgi:aminoglycoside phosphotransferase (APT) family kinase protein